MTTEMICLTFPDEATAVAALAGYCGEAIRVEISYATGVNLGTASDPIDEMRLRPGVHMNVIGGELTQTMQPYIVNPATPSAELLRNNSESGQ